MPFPFLPGGAILAVAVLVGALTIFGLALVALDRAAGRTIVGLRGSIIPGIVTGWRDWAPPRPPDPSARARPPSGALASPASWEPGIEIVDLDGPATPPA